METMLIKILAAFLALSQVTTRPDNIKTKFDAARDTMEVTQVMRDGCAHMRKAFDVESLDLDDLIKTAMDDPASMSTEIKSLHGLKFESLLAVYKQFCKNEDLKDSPVDLAQVIEFYNGAMADLPDYSRLKGTRLAGTGGVLDAKGERFADLTESNRRVWVPLKDIPMSVQKAFVAAEDKRFYEHKGVDERGMIRAMVTNMGRSGRPQGGSTITQQVVKNLLVGDDVTYERKMREVIISSWVEKNLSKQEILELYLNSIYLGRGAWGVELAARNYFGKPVAFLNLQESAMLAGLPKGPTYYSPDRHPERTQERLSYVLKQMSEAGDEAAGTLAAQTVSLPQMVASYERPQQRDSGYYFLDQVTREARALPGITSIATVATTMRTTIRPEIQRAAELALQDGLAQYETRMNRVEWHGPETNLAEAIRKIETEGTAGAVVPTPPAATPAAPPLAPPPATPTAASRGGRATLAPGPGLPPAARAARNSRTPAGPQGGDYGMAVPDAGNRPKPAWQRALTAARMPLYDVHWTTAVVLQPGKGRNGGTMVGLADGRVMPLSSTGALGKSSLNVYDVVFVKVSDGKGKGAHADLRVRATVEGSAVVLDNHTGAILAMVGGFSYPVSQLNRVTQAVRQPGSAIKPFTYLAALRNGLQPNTLVKDMPLTLPPIGNSPNARDKDYWTPKNAEGESGGVATMRRGLELSKNLVTAHLLDGGIDADPSQSLSRVCDLTLDAQIYRDCVAYYPFILGAQPARLIDLAAFYAAIANEGQRPTPYGVESIDQNGLNVYTHKLEMKWLASGDRPAFYQLKSMLQGVVARGTAKVLAAQAPYVAGKTGTSDNENDAWFIGFTNDVTIGVWVGYDNADGKRRTLGNGQTGGKVAAPIFGQIAEATWNLYARKAPLSLPSPEAKRELVAMAVDLSSGNRLGRNGQGQGQGSITEYFRVRAGDVADTQYQLVSPDEVVAAREPGEGEPYGRDPDAEYGGRRPPPNGGFYGPSGAYYANGGGGGGGGGGGYNQNGGGYQNGGGGGGGGWYGGSNGGGGGGGFFQGGFLGGLFGGGGGREQPRQYGSGGAELRPRYYEDRRWAPARRVDPDFFYRDR